MLYRTVPLSMTLSDPEPQLQVHSIVYRRLSRKRRIRSTPMFGSMLGFSGMADRMAFVSSMRFLGSANLMVQFSVTLSDPEPQFQGHSIVYR